MRKIYDGKADCEKWLEEAQGCSICSKIVLKSPIKSKEDLKEIQKWSNWYLSQLDIKIGKMTDVYALKHVINEACDYEIDDYAVNIIVKKLLEYFNQC